MTSTHILITGAASGIGLGILEASHARGWSVTAVIRRQDPSLQSRFPGVRFECFDVLDQEAVKRYFESASSQNRLPDIYFLNAGTNKADHAGGALSVENMREVFDANLWGVFHFIGHALPLARGRRTVFAAASSTVNIFPNPGCLGYFISKLSLHESFKILDRTHRANGIRFKSMVLGPIKTKLLEKNSSATGLQVKVRDWMAVPVKDSAEPILRFLESGSQTLYYPKWSCVFFWILKLVNAVLPVYRVTGSWK